MKAEYLGKGKNKVYLEPSDNIRIANFKSVYMSYPWYMCTPTLKAIYKQYKEMYGWKYDPFLAEVQVLAEGQGLDFVIVKNGFYYVHLVNKEVSEIQKAKVLLENGNLRMLEADHMLVFREEVLDKRKKL